MVTLQRLPYLGTAEADVLFVEWLVAPGNHVARGASIATVETLKASFDVEAETDGVLLRQLCAAGDRLPIQAPIAVVGAAGECCDNAVVHQLIDAAGKSTGSTPAVPVIAPVPFTGTATRSSDEHRVAPTARRLATELGIDVARLVGTGVDGLVRVADVENAHAAANRVPAQAAQDPAAVGRVDAQFLSHVRKDQKAFAALRSDFKLNLYRQHGARIAADCQLGDGTVMLVDQLVLGERAFLGPDCTIEAQRLETGPLLHFGARCRVRCTRLHFGENAFFTDDIEIGGGGAMDPEAELIVGSHGFVGEHVHLNPCRRLQIGDEVVVSRNAVVMTHSFGPSWLRGYASRFDGVTIGDGAQIGIMVTLFPGVDVGAGAVILSGSSVVTSVPPGRLFGGVPAVDLKGAAQQLSPRELAERAAVLVAEFARQLQLRGLPAVVEKNGDHVTVSVAQDDGMHQLDFVVRAAAGIRSSRSHPAMRESVLVAIEFDDAAMSAVALDSTAIALEPPRVRGPLGPLASAFREFLRKRGVRLHPRGWAYTGGWL